MTPEPQYATVNRVVSTQDLTWLLEQHRRGQLDLDPPYQRRSVWTPRDRRYFMDTVFKNYPSPAIFLHKSIDFSTGDSMYHVVDGKQRILTVLMYLNNKVTLPPNFGDSRFDGRRWRDLETDEARSRLWNYRVTIEEVDDVSPTFVQEVFERLNKNSRKLTPQELRHARFDGWMIHFLEEEVLQPVWANFKIRTTAKEKRMADVQNLAELAMITERDQVSGFDQEDIDSFFAEFDEVEGEDSTFNVDEFTAKFYGIRDWLSELDRSTGVVSTLAQPFMHFYTLWSFAAREIGDLPDMERFGVAYSDFMHEVGEYEIPSEVPGAESALSGPNEGDSTEVAPLSSEDCVRIYKTASKGATTELPQRTARLDALVRGLSLRLGVE